MTQRPSPAGQLPSISEAIDDYLLQIELSRSRRTFRTYQTGMNHLRDFLALNDFNIEEDRVSSLAEGTAGYFAEHLLGQRFSPATINLYLTSLTGFFEYLALDLELPLDLERVRRLLKSKTPRVKRRLPQFDWQDIERVIAYALQTDPRLAEDEKDRLRLWRDRAIIITLADTGLRVHEACSLARSDLDWSRQVALITGKGDKDALIRFSGRAVQAIQAYLSARASLDRAAGRQLAGLPLFARHDRAAGKRVLPLSTYSVEKTVSQYAWLALQDEEKAARITPHSFRHYFVTRVVRATNNIKVAQELARHENIATTEIYTHLIDQDLDDFYRQVVEDT